MTHPLPALAHLLDQPLRGDYPLPEGESEGEWRRRAQAAVAALAGRLDQPCGFGQSLGSALHHATTAPLPASLAANPGRVRLVGELVRNLAHPDRINQGHKGTCSVACVESWLAEAWPGEYARLVGELMDEDGAGRLKNGDTIRRDEEHLAWHAAEARRSPASRLFQVAAMEYAYPELDYVNVADGHLCVDGENTGTGLGLDAFDRLLEGLTGQDWARLSTADEAQTRRMAARFGLSLEVLPDLRRDAPAILAASLAAGDPVFVTLEARQPGEEGARRVGEHPLLQLPHKVRVLRVDAETDRVWFDDPLDPEVPWMPGVDTRVENRGGHCSMARGDFFGLLVELSCLPAHVPRLG